MFLLREYNQATSFVAPLLKSDGSFATDADWASQQAGEVKISQAGATATNIASLPSYDSNIKGWKFDLSAAEMQTSEITITVQANGLQDDAFVVTTFGALGAQLPLATEADVDDAGALLVETTIASVTSQTEFTLNGGTSVEAAYNGGLIVINSAANNTDVSFRQIENYTGSSKSVSISDPLPFTVAVGDLVKIYANLGTTETSEPPVSTVVDLLAKVPATGTGTSWYFDQSGNLQQTSALRNNAYDFNGNYLGTLLEPQRTNEVRNNTMQGAASGVLGSGGMLPYQWWYLTEGIGSWEITGIGTENGLPYLELFGSFNNTTASTHYPAVYSDSATYIAASAGDNWSSSSFVKILEIDGGSNPFPSGVGVFWQIAQYKGTSQYLESDSVFLSENVGQFQHPTVSIAITNAETEFVTPLIGMVVPSGVVVSTKFRIYAPQLEKGSFATSPILTSNGAVTRANDPQPLISDTSAGLTEGTLVADYQMLSSNDQSAAGDLVASSSGGGSNNVALQLTRLDAQNVPAIVAGSSPQTEAYGPTNSAIGDSIKVAARWSGTDLQCAVNGAAGGGATIAGNAYAGTNTQWQIRSDASQAVAIRSLEVHDSAKTQAELIALTS